MRPSFQGNFWRQVKQDRAACDVMYRIPQKNHNRVVRLLEAVSDPRVSKRLRRSSVEINAHIFRSVSDPGPSRKELRGLARRLLTISRDIERLFASQRMRFKRDHFLKLAEDCRLRSRDLKYVDWARLMSDAPTKVPRKLTYKAFWKHLPMAMLCRALDAPRTVTFPQVEALLRCAEMARGLNPHSPPRRLEREIKTLLKHKSGNVLKDAVWPQMIGALLDGILSNLPSTK